MTIPTLWLPSWYPHKGQKFFGSFVYRQALAVSRFCDLTVLYVVQSDDAEMLMEEMQIDDNFLQILVYVPKQKTRIGKLIQFWKAYQLGWTRLKTLNRLPKITHVHVIYPAGIFALWLNWRQKIPFVISEHWSGYRKKNGDYKGWFLTNLVERCVAKSKKIITVSNQGKLAMQQHGLDGDYTIIPNVVATDKIPSLKEKTSEKCHFVHVSSLEDRHKNITGLFKVIKALSEIRTDFFLEIIGGNPVEYRHYFEKMSADMGLQNFITFTGLIPNEKMFEQLTKADAFVSFSNMEGLSCAMLEALAVGLPVIATETGDVKEWVPDSCGTVIEIGDEPALLKALIAMIEQHTNYDAAMIRQRIVDTCGSEVVGKRITSIYQEALNF